MISEVEEGEGGSKSKERGGEGPVTVREPVGAFSAPNRPRMKFVTSCNCSLRVGQAGRSGPGRAQRQLRGGERA